MIVKYNEAYHKFVDAAQNLRHVSCVRCGDTLYFGSEIRGASAGLCRHGRNACYSDFYIWAARHPYIRNSINFFDYKVLSIAYIYVHVWLANGHHDY